MGYSTDFWDEFTIDKPLDDETYALLEGLSQTRRMSRDIVKLGKRVYEIENPTPEDIANWEKEFGCEGEFWVGDQDKTEDVINDNQPPATQPGLWCQWEILEDRQTIIWDGGEKFYEYIAWIEYIIDRILKPRGYTVNGEVTWQGEESTDAGIISITNNHVEVKGRVSFYLNDKDAARVNKLVKDYLENSLKEILDEKIDKEV